MLYIPFYKDFSAEKANLLTKIITYMFPMNVRISCTVYLPYNNVLFHAKKLTSKHVV
jgi:hypothetical protein